MTHERMGYLTGVKHAVVTALRDSPMNGFDSTHVGIEYPLKNGEYPYVWVEFQQKSLQSMNMMYDDAVEDAIQGRKRWEFEGTLSFMFFALLAKERDELFDAFVETVGFFDGFKDSLSSNDFIAIDVNTEVIGPGAQTASEGTPWGTDDMVYTTSATLECRGEFETSLDTTFPLIKRVDVHPRTEGEQDLPDSTDGEWH